jgi:dephospho-CoA kinase
MLHVGLTGNMAAGKSQAAQVFAELGAHVLDADQIAHGLMSPGTESYAKVVQAFGEGILNLDGTINRKSLGRIIFSDENARLRINALIHPEVNAEILRRIVDLETKYTCGITIVHAALLVESGHHRIYDRLIVVTCDPKLQLARIINRGLTPEEAQQRLAAQMPIEEKLRLADFTIETSGPLRETKKQIEAIYRDLLLHEMQLRESDQ